ncbi:hypothetical protein [Variovorax gossypii]|jgi:hypothetical protein
MTSEMTEPATGKKALSNPDEAHELYGRMLESIDIERAIESGQFKTLDDVLVNVRASAAAIDADLRRAGFYSGGVEAGSSAATVMERKPENGPFENNEVETDPPHLCRLPPSGFTETDTRVFRWAEAAVVSLRGSLHGPITASLSSYRWDGGQMLALDLEDGNGRRQAINFTAPFEHSFCTSDPLVPDLVEAMHMANIVLRALDVTLEVGGYWQNEVNSEIAPRACSTDGSAPMVVRAA